MRTFLCLIDLSWCKKTRRQGLYFLRVFHRFRYIRQSPKAIQNSKQLCIRTRSAINQNAETFGFGSTLAPGSGSSIHTLWSESLFLTITLCKIVPGLLQHTVLPVFVWAVPASFRATGNPWGLLLWAFLHFVECSAGLCANVLFVALIHNYANTLLP